MNLYVNTVNKKGRKMQILTRRTIKKRDTPKRSVTQ